MRVYADSSFLVSCYLIDANTARAKAFLSEHDEPLPFTALHELEVRNALRLGVFRRVITDEQAKAAAAAIDADLRNGRLVRTTVKWPIAFRTTLRLSEQHAAKTGTRSLDILHVASARALRMKELATFRLAPASAGRGGRLDRRRLMLAAPIAARYLALLHGRCGTAPRSA